jgi:cytochrome P450
MPAFAYRHIKDLYPTFWTLSGDLAKVLTNVVKQKAETSSTLEKAPIPSAVISMSDWLSRATLDIIGVAGMGQSFNALYDPDTELNKTYRTIFQPSRQARTLALMGLFLPPRLLALLPVKRNNDIASATKSIRGVARNLIEQKKLTIANKEKPAEVDILSVAMESGGFTEDNLVDQLMTFLAAGHETTATAMCWALLALCQHPEMQERLRTEIHKSLPSIEDNTTPMSAEVMDRLPYLHAMCNEVLRFYAPVPITRRETAKDTTILGQFIPKGTDIILAPSAVNISKEMWGENALEFDPDRWMGPGRTNSGGATSNYANLTFLHGKLPPSNKFKSHILTTLSGPRSCIGMAFAKAEFACLLAAVVGRFEMELEDKDAKIELENGITARPKGGLPLRMKVLDGW